MKKVLFPLIIALVSYTSYAQNLNVHQKNKTNTFLLYDVDSITHNNSILNIYYEGQLYEQLINSIDSITISKEQVEFYKILSEQINGWDSGIYCKSSDDRNFYIVSKTDSVESEGGKVCVCLNSFTNEDVNKAAIFNYDASGRLYDIIYYGIQFKAEIVLDSMSFVAYDSSGNYLGNFCVPYETIEFEYLAGHTRSSVLKRQPPHPFWLNSKGRVSLPKIIDFGRKAYALADLYGKQTSDIISTAINLSEGRYGEIIKDYLIGGVTALSGLPFFPLIIAEVGINNMSNHFYEQEKQKYLGDSQIEITSIERVDDKHINVKGIINNVSTIPSTYSISSNIFGESWPNVVYWGVAEGKSGQPGFFINEDCSVPMDIEGDNFSYTFIIPITPGETFYFRPFLAPKDKIEEIESIPNPFTCIRYGERKEYFDFDIELSNFSRNDCFKTNSGYEVCFSIDGNIPGLFNELSNWGITVKTQNTSAQNYYAKKDNSHFPPTNTAFSCSIVIDQSEIVKENNILVSEVTITPFYTLWNNNAASFLDSKKYKITLNENICPDENHPHWIDLGLPSGTKWSCCNEGASTPESSGVYYQFGKVHSAPTVDQIKELLNNTTSNWMTLNGANGRRYKSKINGNEIFLPATGMFRYGDYENIGVYGTYWSCTPTEEKDYFFGLSFNSAYSGDCYPYWHQDKITVRSIHNE